MTPYLRRARENLTHTYVTLASGVPGTVVHRGPHFTQTVARAPLTICNMIIDCQIPAEARAASMEGFANAASVSRAFRVFNMTGDAPEDLGLMLMAEGFSVEYALTLLKLDSPPKAFTNLELVTTDADRRQIIEFMVGMFFSRRDPTLRRLILEANYRSPFELWVQGTISAPQGAVMLVETEGALGMYNLCVAPRSRGAGVGSNILAFCQAQAASRGRQLTFQADTRMLNWYRERGSIEIGSVKIFTNSTKMR